MINTRTKIILGLIVLIIIGIMYIVVQNKTIIDVKDDLETSVINQDKKEHEHNVLMHITNEYIEAMDNINKRIVVDVESNLSDLDILYRERGRVNYETNN